LATKVSKPDPTDFRRVKATIKRLWNDDQREYTLDAVDEMQKERIDEADIQHVIRFGKIVSHDLVDDVWRYRFHGRAVDGARAGVVVEVRPWLIIITAFLR